MGATGLAVTGASARRLAERVRSGEITSTEVVELHLGRIAEVNAAVNASCSWMLSGHSSMPRRPTTS